MDRLTITRHCHRHVHVKFELCCEVRVRGKSELVSGEDEVVELGVEHGHDQQERDDRDWNTVIAMLNRPTRLTIAPGRGLLDISLRDFREGVDVSEDLGDGFPSLPQPPAAGQPAHCGLRSLVILIIIFYNGQTNES